MTKVEQFYACNICDINKQLDRLGLDSRDIITIVEVNVEGVPMFSIFYHKEVTNENSSSS